MNKNNTLFFNHFVLRYKKYFIKNLVMLIIFFFLYHFREAAIKKTHGNFHCREKSGYQLFTNFHL
jgi:hypothetical protein